MRDPPSQDASASSEIGRLRRRADFVRVGAGKRWHAAGLTLQAAPAAPGSEAVRVGFTLTRKVGNAVVRNRARRRLKEAVRLSGDLPVRAGHDYVIVGRIEALRLPFEELKRELDRAVRSIHEARSGAGRSRRPGRKNRKTDGNT